MQTDRVFMIQQNITNSIYFALRRLTSPCDTSKSVADIWLVNCIRCRGLKLLFWERWLVSLNNKAIQALDFAVIYPYTAALVLVDLRIWCTVFIQLVMLAKTTDCSAPRISLLSCILAVCFVCLQTESRRLILGYNFCSVRQFSAIELGQCFVGLISRFTNIFLFVIRLISIETWSKILYFTLKCISAPSAIPSPPPLWYLS